MEATIQKKLNAALNPTELMIACVDADSAKYEVKVVSEKFTGLSLVKCHRMVNDALADELANNSIHALSIKTSAPKS